MLKLWWLYRERNYWAQRAAALEAKLENESKRNRHFEREMVSRIVTMTGQMGIAQEKVAQPNAPQVLPPIPPQPTQNVLSGLTAGQRERWQDYLDAVPIAGVSENQAWQDFYNSEILSKMTISDDALVDVEN